MQVAPAGLHGEILLRPDGVGHRRALERRADVEAPELFERFVVVGDHPAILQRREYQAAGRVGRARSDFDVGHRLREHLVVDGVEGGDRSVVQVAAVGALLAVLLVDAALRRQVGDGGAVSRGAALDADAIGDVLHRVVGGRLMRDAAVPGRTGPLGRVAAQRPRGRIVDLHVEPRIVVERFARLRIEPLGPVQIVDVLAADEEFTAGAIQRVEEPVAREMADDLAAPAVERRVVQHVHADFVVVPGIVRRVLEVPRQLAGVDVQGDDGVGVEVVARARLRIVNRHRIAGAPDGELRRRVVGAGLPQAAASGLPGVVGILPGFAARIARLRHDVPAPELLARSRIERRDPAARLGVAGAVGDNHLAVGGDRRRIEAFHVAEFVGRRHLLVPHDFAGVAVDRNHAAVGQIGDDQVFPERDPARARHVPLVLHAGVGHPDEFPLVGTAAVDLVERPPAVARVEEAVVDQRMELAFRTVLSDVLHAAERQGPHQPKLFDVRAVDLRQLRIPRGGIVAVHHQPVLRLVLRVAQPILTDRHRVLAGDRGRGQRRHGETRQSRPGMCFHDGDSSALPVPRRTSGAP